MTDSPAVHAPTVNREHRVRVALVAAATVVAVAAVAVAAAWLLWSRLGAGSTPGFIGGHQFDSVAIGDSRPETIKRIGRPLLAERSGVAPVGTGAGRQLGPAPSGASCDYYQEIDAIEDPGVMRFCYRGGVVVEKSAYDMGSGIRGGDAGTELCVWRSGRAGPTCS